MAVADFIRVIENIYFTVFKGANIYSVYYICRGYKMCRVLPDDYLHKTCFFTTW